jgi:hypothetical protein
VLEVSLKISCQVGPTWKLVKFRWADLGCYLYSGGVFDCLALHGLVGEPGLGQPRPGSPRLLLLFDSFASGEPS